MSELQVSELQVSELQVSELQVSELQVSDLQVSELQVSELQVSEVDPKEIEKFHWVHFKSSDKYTGREAAEYFKTCFECLDVCCGGLGVKVVDFETAKELVKRFTTENSEYAECVETPSLYN